MDKYVYLDNRGRRSFSADSDTAPGVDAAIAFLVEFWDVSISAAVCHAVVGYARLMRGLDVEQAAAIQGFVQWLGWINEQPL